jgi:hypothetical protein
MVQIFCSAPCSNMPSDCSLPLMEISLFCWEIIWYLTLCNNCEQTQLFCNCGGYCWLPEVYLIYECITFMDLILFISQTNVMFLYKHISGSSPNWMNTQWNIIFQKLYHQVTQDSALALTDIYFQHRKLNYLSMWWKHTETSKHGSEVKSVMLYILNTSQEVKNAKNNQKFNSSPSVLSLQ